MRTLIYDQVVRELGIEPRCHHTTLGAMDSGMCPVCGHCFHRKIIRENPGSHNEIQWCDRCGEERIVGYGGF